MGWANSLPFILGKIPEVLGRKNLVKFSNFIQMGATGSKLVVLGMGIIPPLMTGIPTNGAL